ncbi:MAG: hypothetical protein ORN51_08840, partial [Akkermansiaceae bacterium]|nr:hypothetical protein [Akkermansiaceae bacterium]
TLVGTPYADTLDSGTGSDTVTGGYGIDRFIDESTTASGEIDTLVETMNRDVSLFDNWFVHGTILADDGTSPFFKGNHITEQNHAVVDPLFPTPYVDSLKDRGDVYSSSNVEMESLLKFDGVTPIFKVAVLTGSTDNNTMVVGDFDRVIQVGGTSYQVSPWTGKVTLDNYGNGGRGSSNGDSLNEYYIVNLVNDTGTRVYFGTQGFNAVSGAAYGYSELYVYGTDNADTVTLLATPSGAGSTGTIIFGKQFSSTQMERKTDENGNLLYYLHDSNGNKVQRTDDKGKLIYDLSAGVTLSTGAKPIWLDTTVNTGDPVMVASANPSRAQVVFTKMNRVTVNTLGDQDSVTVIDTAAPTIIRLGTGDDLVTIGIVPQINDPGNTSLDYPLGVPIADVKNLTNGNSHTLVVYGSRGNDQFEVNHNASKVFLAGEDGDDTFVINTFLVLTDGQTQDIANLTTLFGGGGTNRYTYLQNAPVFISGGSGTDTVVINGTPVSDTFIVTDKYVVGAGRIVYFTGIERLEINAGGGDDKIYVLSTPTELEVTVRGGSGNDIINLGGDPPALAFDPPASEYYPPSYQVQDAPVPVVRQLTLAFGGVWFNFDGDVSRDAIQASVRNYLDAVLAVYGQLYPGLRAAPGTNLDTVARAAADHAAIGVYYRWLFWGKRSVVFAPISPLVLDYDSTALPPLRTVTPASVKVDPPPFAFKQDAVFDLSGIQGRLTIDGGIGQESAGDQLIVHAQNSRLGLNGELVQTTIPRLTGEQFQVYTKNGVEIRVSLDRAFVGNSVLRTFYDSASGYFTDTIYAPAYAVSQGYAPKMVAGDVESYTFKVTTATQDKMLKSQTPVPTAVVQKLDAIVGVTYNSESSFHTALVSRLSASELTAYEPIILSVVAQRVVDASGNPVLKPGQVGEFKTRFTRTSEQVDQYLLTALVQSELITASVPAAVVSKLNPILGTTYADDASLHLALKGLLGESDLKLYESLILQKSLIKVASDTRSFFNLVGLGMGNGKSLDGTPYRGVEYRNFEGMQILLSDFADTFTLTASEPVPLTLSMGGGNDVVYIKDAEASVRVMGGGGDDMVNVSDAMSLARIHDKLTLEGDTYLVETQTHVLYDPTIPISDTDKKSLHDAVLSSAIRVYVDSNSSGVRPDDSKYTVYSFTDASGKVTKYARQSLAPLVFRGGNNNSELWIRALDLNPLTGQIQQDEVQRVDSNGVPLWRDTNGSEVAWNPAAANAWNAFPSQLLDYNASYLDSLRNFIKGFAATVWGSSFVAVVDSLIKDAILQRIAPSLIPVNRLLAAGKVLTQTQITEASNSVGFDTLNLDDGANSTASSGVLDKTSLTGLTASAIHYAGMEVLNIRLGTNSDLFTIQDTHAGATNLYGNAGNEIINVRNVSGATTVDGGIGFNTMNVGSAAAGTTASPNVNVGGHFYGIKAALTIRGGGNATLNLDDTASTLAKQATLASTTLSGRGVFGTGGSLVYADLTELNINLGSGGNTVNVQGTHAGKTYLNSGSGSDTINVGSSAEVTSDQTGTLDDMVGELILVSNTGTNVLNIDDAGRIGGSVATVTYNCVTGLGMGGGIRYDSVSELNLYTGRGADTVTVDSIAPGHTTISTGGGGDILVSHGGVGGTGERFLVLNGGNDGDDYRIDLSKAEAGQGGSFIQIADTGTSGDDVLDYRGNNNSGNFIQLDTVYLKNEDAKHEFSQDRWVGYGKHGDGLIIGRLLGDSSSFKAQSLSDADSLFNVTAKPRLAESGGLAILNYASVERVMVYGGSKNDTFVSDDTSSAMNIYGLGGNDQFYVGTVIAAQQVLVDGKEISIVSEVTHGASVAMNFYGGEGDDYFEASHNTADIALYGDNGDDTFFIKALLTLDTAGEVKQVATGVANITGKTGSGSEQSQKDNDTREVDIDSLAYVQNANIKIDGGAGFNSVAVVGTALSDTFYVFTEIVNAQNVQRIYGAGVKLNELINIQRIQLITGPGDDRVYVYGVDLGPVADLVINTGSGSDTVVFGGPQLTMDLAFPKVKATRYASVPGFTDGFIASLPFGLGIEFLNAITRVVPFVVETPATTVTKVIAATDSFSAIRNPVLVQDPDGLLDAVVFNNQSGPASLVYESLNIGKKGFETNKLKIGFPTLTTASGTMSDLVAQMGRLLPGAGRDRVINAINDFLINDIGFTNKYYDPNLISRLAALSASQSEALTIPAGVTYAAFQNTIDGNNSLLTARSQLESFLAGTGFSVSYTTTPNPNGGPTLLYDIRSISAVGGQQLAWRGQYDSVIKDGVTYKNLIGVSLVTAAAVAVNLNGGYLTDVKDASSEIWDSVHVNGAAPSVYFQGMDEVDINLSTATAGSLTLSSTNFAGKTVVHGGAAGNVFNVNAAIGATFIYGGAGTDVFNVGSGSGAAITKDLFLFGGAGSNTINVHSETHDTPTVSLDRNTVQHTLEETQTSKVTNALEFDSITTAENSLISDALKPKSVAYALEAAKVSASQLERIERAAAVKAATIMEAALAAARVNFSNAIDAIVVQQKGIFTAFLRDQLADYDAARTAKATAQSALDANQARYEAAQGIYDLLNNLIKVLGLGQSVKEFADRSDISQNYPTFVTYVHSLITTIDDQKALKQELDLSTQLLAGCEANLTVYLTLSQLDGFYSSIHTSNTQVQAAITNALATSQVVQTKLASIESGLRDAAAMTFTKIDAALVAVRAVLAPNSNLSATMSAVPVALDSLIAYLSSTATTNDERLVWLERMDMIKDVKLVGPRATLTQVSDLITATPGTAAFTAAAQFTAKSAPTYADAVALFSNADFAKLVQAYDKANTLAQSFTDFLTDTYLDFRTVFVNMSRFQTFLTFLGGTFDFNTFKTDYLNNIRQLNASALSFDQLALEAQYQAQLDSLLADQDRAQAISSGNTAVVQFFSARKDAASKNLSSIVATLVPLYTVTYNFFWFRYTFYFDYTRDARYVAAKSESDAATADYLRASLLQTAAQVGQDALNQQVILLQGNLATLNTTIGNNRENLKNLKQTLNSQYTFLRDLSTVTLNVLTQTRKDNAGLGFSDKSSLIAEIEKYSDTYVVSGATGINHIKDTFETDSKNGSLVRHEVKNQDTFTVLSLTGVTAAGIHADSSSFQNFNIYLSNTSTAVVVNAALDRSDSLVNIVSGAGKDTYTVNEAASATVRGSLTINSNAGDDSVRVKNISGDLVINAGNGSDTVEVYDDTARLYGIGAVLTVKGQSDAGDTLNLFNSQDQNGAAGTLTATDITGLGMGAGGRIHYETLEVLNLSLGYGDDDLTIESTAVGTDLVVFTDDGADHVTVKATSGKTYLILGAGADVVDVIGAGANGLQSIQGALKIEGKDNSLDQASDTVNVIDTTSVGKQHASGYGGLLSSVALQGLLMGAEGIAFSHIDVLSVTLGGGDDTLDVLGTLEGGFTTIGGGGGNDKIKLETVSDKVSVLGGNGNDIITLFDGNGDFAKVGSYLTLDAGTGDDTITLNLGRRTGLIIDVKDSNPVGGYDTLVINGTDLPDAFYLGAGDKKSDLSAGVLVVGQKVDALAALLYYVQDTDSNNNGVFDKNGLPVMKTSAGGAKVETTSITEFPILLDNPTRDTVNYAGMDKLTVNSHGGNDRFLVEDTAVETEIRMGDNIGDAGYLATLDHDQITIATVATVPDSFGIPVVNFEKTTKGNSAKLSVWGGEGDDEFDVNHNEAELFLYGEAGDDVFAVNTYLVLTSSGKGDTPVNLSTLDGGAGHNSYQYLQNAPVHINGGTGNDTLIITGTPIADIFIVTDQYIAGAGRQVLIDSNIEKIIIQSAGGNDEIYVLSTSNRPTNGGATFETIVRGGSGDDRVYVGGDPPVLVFDPPPIVVQPASVSTVSYETVTTAITVDPAPFVKTISPAEANDAGLAALKRRYALGGNDAVVQVIGTTFAVVTQSFNFFGQTFNFSYLASYVVVLIDQPSYTISYPTTRTVVTTITPPPITVDPPPFAFKAPAVRNLTGIQGKLTIDGGTGDDQVIIHNELGAAGTATLGTAQVNENGGVRTTNVFTGLGLGVEGIQLDNVDSLDVRLGSGVEVINIDETITGTTKIDGGGGDDVFNVRAISGNTTIWGAGGNDTVNVFDNNGSLAGIKATLKIDGDAHLDEQTINWVNGLNSDGAKVDVPASPLVVNQDGQQFTTVGSGGVKTFHPGADGLAYVNVAVLNADGSVKTDAASNTITMRVELPFPNKQETVQSIVGVDAVNIRDIMGSLQVTLNESNFKASNMQGEIVYGSGPSTIDSLNITLGDGADTIQVQGTNVNTVTTIHAGGGNDTILVGFNASLNTVQGALHIDADSGRYNRLVVDGSADTAADTNVVISKNSISGLALGNITFTASAGYFASSYAAASSTFSDGVAVYAGLGNDNILINSTRDNSEIGVIEVTSIYAGAGNDKVTVADSGVRYLTVHGQAGDDSILTLNNALGLISVATSGFAAFGDEGNDELVGGLSSNVLVGGLGNDRVSSGGGSDVVFGDDALIIRRSDYQILWLSTANDSLGGSDVLSANGNAVIFGGAGDDQISDVSNVGGSIILGDNGELDFAGGDVYTIDPLLGGADTITGGQGNNIIIGGAQGDY